MNQKRPVVAVSGEHTVQVARAIAEAFGDLRSGIAAYPSEAVPDLAVLQTVVTQLLDGLRGFPNLLDDLQNRLYVLRNSDQVKAKTGSLPGTGLTAIETVLQADFANTSSQEAARELGKRLAVLSDILNLLQPSGGGQ